MRVIALLLIELESNIQAPRQNKYVRDETNHFTLQRPLALEQSGNYMYHLH
jgi:hypothetical protein